MLCDKCEDLLKQCRFEAKGRCDYCLGALNDSNCINCKNYAYPYRFDTIRACYHYEGLYKSIFQQYKFHGDVALAKLIGQQLNVKVWDFDMIIPIPSVEDNDLARTFNPVQHVLQVARVPFENCLTMHRRPKQFTLNLKERLDLENGIAIRSDICLENKRIFTCR